MKRLKKYNINDYIYIQINETGWNHLRSTVGESYIKHCIKNKEYVIDGKIWYRLQCHSAFDIFKTYNGRYMPFNSNVLFESHSMSNLTKREMIKHKIRRFVFKIILKYF